MCICSCPLFPLSGRSALSCRPFATLAAVGPRPLGHCLASLRAGSGQREAGLETMTGTKNTYVPEWIEWPEWVEWPEWQDAGCFAGCQDNGHAANWKFIHVKRGRQAYRRPARWKADRRPRPVPGFRALKHLKADYRNFDTFSAYPWPRVECECECEDVAPLRDSFGIREELSPAEKNRAELGWVCGFPWVWWDRRQFVWMMLNELSPPPWTLLMNGGKMPGTKVNYMHSLGSPGQVLYFVRFLLFCVLLRFSSDSLNCYSVFILWVFFTICTLKGFLVRP